MEEQIKRINIKFILLIGILIIFLIPNYSLGSFKAKAYNFTDDEIRRIAAMCCSENGSSTDAMRAEASLMANLYEKNGDGKYTTSGFIRYITTSGWFASSCVDDYYNPYTVSSSYLEAVRDVLINGNRYFPIYVDEHDWLGDISSVSNDGVSFDPYDRSKYKKGVTKIRNCYGATYTFYCFPDDESDPFGYIDIDTNSGELSSISVKKAPTKVKYNVGDTLNTKGLTLVGKYTNYTEKQITTGFTCTPTKLNTAGTQTITVTYQGKKATFKVTVAKKTIDMSGIKFENKTVKYNGKAQNIVISGTLPTGVKVKYEGNEKKNAGKYTVTAKFEVDTTKYNAIPNKTAILTIQKATPKVTPNYDKNQKLYVGDELPKLSLSEGDTKGTIKWDEYTLATGTKEYGWTFTPEDKTNYNTKKGKLSFSVLPLEFESVKVTNPPKKVNYVEGQNFDKTGMKVEAVYSNGKSKEVTNYTIKNGEKLKLGQNSVIVVYTENNKTKEVEQAIKVELLGIDINDKTAYKVEDDASNSYIEKIEAETSIEVFLNNVKANGEIKIYKDGIEVVDKKLKIATGMMAKVINEDKMKEYILIVDGDCNGDSKVNVADLTILINSIAENLSENKNTNKMLKGAYNVAVDLNGDGKVNVSDMTLLCMLIAKSK